MQTTVAAAQGTAVAYHRVSTTQQAGERHVSLEVQGARTGAYVRAKGYTLVRTFTDVASGRRDDRAQYQAMLDFVRQGAATLIVIQSSTGSDATRGKSSAGFGSLRRRA